MKHILFTVFFYLIFSCQSFGLNPNLIREIAILDLTKKNSETNSSNLFSAEHICKTMGIPYVLTDSLSKAFKYSVIFTTSEINCSTFTTAEQNHINQYVSNGGIIIAPQLNCSNFNSLFGISASTVSTKRHRINWIEPANDKALRWINDSLERSISLGSYDYTDVISSRSYNLTMATALAYYEDGSVAVLENTYGGGKVYSLGLALNNIILKNQLNQDYEAQRTYGENFEPTSDVIMLFVKGIFAKHVPFAAWKNTAPRDYKAVLIMTHDVDARASMDTMKYFAEYEKKHNIAAEYFITTHYMQDCNDADYYTQNIAEINYVRQNGQEIGSHSVGHFEDFDNSTTFPMGSAGNTMQNYIPKYNCSQTTGGTVFGECEVSKKLLQQDVAGTDIRAFRSGYLAFNKNQITVLDSLGYLYDLTQSANDVLTHFPYQQHREQRFNGRLSNVYELPLTMDADPITEENYYQIAVFHLGIIDKIKDNNGIITVLLHPTHREWKLKYEDYLLSHLPDDIKIMGVEEFGDFWKQRENFSYATNMPNDTTLNITLAEAQSIQSIVINDGKALKHINVKDKSGNSITAYSSAFADNDIVLYFSSEQNNGFVITEEPKSQSKCIGDNVSFSVDISGTLPFSFQWYHDNLQLTIDNGQLELNNISYADSGKYYCVVRNRYQQLTTEVATLKVFAPFSTDITAEGSRYTSISGQLFFCSTDSVKLRATNNNTVVWQWRKNGSVIAGGTSSSYFVHQSGQYSLQTGNAAGCATLSNSISLTKYKLPSVTVSSAAKIAFCLGDSLLLSSKLSNIEDFESGDMKAFDWATSPVVASWAVNNSSPYQGNYSAKSGLITNLQSSELSISMYNADIDSISFYRKVSSELNYDFLSFYINDVMIAKWSGEQNWTKFAYQVNKGLNIFKWVYSKDKSLISGSDCAWIDKISFPISVISSASALSYVWKKNNTDITSATYSKYYCRDAGSYSVKTIDNTGCSSSSLSVSINVDLKPIVNLGNDTTISTKSNIVLNAGDAANSYLWNNGSIQHSLTINASQIRKGKHVYSVRVASENICIAYDTITINISDSTQKNCLFRSIGHRGGSSYNYPENTLLSLQQAFIEGAWACEVDVRKTSDNILVLMHDSLVDRTTSGSGIVSQLPLSYIKTLDAGSCKDKKFAGEKVPTLLEAIQLANKYHRKLYLDYKITDAEILSRTLAESGAPADIIILEPDGFSSLSLFHQYLPNTPSCYFGSIPANINDTTFYLFLKQNGAISMEIAASDFYSHTKTWIDSYIGYMHKYGLELWIYTINDINSVSQLQSWGVDGIETDRPGPALDITCYNGDGGYFPEKRITGQWDFNTKDLSATIGSAMHERGNIQTSGQHATFGKTTEFNIPKINGQDANVMRVPPYDADHYLEFYSNIAVQEDPSGFTCDNEYTIIMDILKPSDSKPYVSLLQTSHSNDDDADVFINNSNEGIGINGTYNGRIEKNKWYRVAMIFDLPAGTFDKYINGDYVGTTPMGSNALNGRFCLNNNWGVQSSCFFSDDDNETDSLYVNSIQLRDYAMTAAEVALMGSVSDKIPTDIISTDCPVVYIAPKDTLVCEGSSAGFSITASDNVNYSWEVNKGIVWSELTEENYSGQSSPVLKINEISSSMNNYKYRCIVKNQCSISSAAATLRVTPFVNVIVANSSSDNICKGSSAVLNAIPGNGYNYQWIYNGNNIDGAINSAYSASGTGEYSVVLGDNNGCAKTSEPYLIRVYSAPRSVIYASDTTAICSNDSVKLYSDMNNFENFETADFSSYSWIQKADHPWIITKLKSFDGIYSLRSGVISNLQQSSISIQQFANQNDSISFYYKVSSEKNYDFLYFYINDIYVGGWSGEVDWSMFSFALNPGLNTFKWVYFKDKSVSSGSDCAWIDRVVFPSSGSAISYQWLKNGSLIQAETHSFYYAKNNANYTLESIKEPQGCSAISNSISVNEIVQPLVSLVPSGKINLCEGSSASFICQILSDKNYSYQWRNNGVEIIGATTSMLTTNMQGIYDIIIKAKDKLGCSFTSQKDTVIINPLPLASITPLSSVNFCSGDSVSLIAPSTEGYSYLWKKDNIILQGATNSDFFAISGGDYTVMITDKNNCSNSSQPLTILTHSLPIAKMTPEFDTAFCAGASVMLNAYKSAGYKFQWYRDNSIIQNAVLSSFKVSSDGYYSVVVTNDNNCSARSQIIKITVNPYPVVKITPSANTTFCSGQSVQLKASSGDSYKYQWIKDEQQINAATNSAYTAMTTGDYNVVITNINYCSAESSADVRVTVNPLPLVNLGKDTSITRGQKLVLDAGPDESSYFWNNGLIDRTISVDGLLLGVGDYVFSVFVSNSYGCENYDSIKVNVRDATKIISGILYYDNSQKSVITNTKIYLNKIDGAVVDSALTDGVGYFEFSDIEAGKYLLNPLILKKWGGSDPVDALLINRYFVTIYSFRDMLSKRAADVNKDNRYNPTDGLNISKRFVKIVNSFPAGDWIYERDTLTLNNEDISCFIKALCVGDVNGSYGISMLKSDGIFIFDDGEILFYNPDSPAVPYRVINNKE